MRINVRNVLLAAAIVASLVFAVTWTEGCHRGQAAASSATLLTPYQHAVAWNQALADANHAVSSAVIAGQRLGNISVEDAARITSTNYQIAAADKEVTAILALGPASAELKGDRLRDLLSQIRDSSYTLVNTKLFVKNGESTVVANSAIDTMFFLSGQIIDALVKVKVIEEVPNRE